MSAYDVASTGSGDAYAKMVEQQKQYAQDYENYVHGVLVPKDAQAEKKEYTSYVNMKYATGVFDAASNDKLTLQQQLDKITQERDYKINEIQHKIAKLERENTPEAKEQIKELQGQIPIITAQYAGRIQNLQFNIERAGRTTLLKQSTLAEARSIYQSDRYDRISTSNDVYSGFLQASSNWLDAGKMQQQLNYTQSQVRKSNFEAMG